MINYHMLTKSLQRLITAKRICAADRSHAGMSLDIGHERLCRDRLFHPGAGPSIPLQQAEYDTFPPGATSTMPVMNSTKAELLQLDLIGQHCTCQFSGMKQRDAQPYQHHL